MLELTIAIGILLPAFYWLLAETHYLTIRLLAGPDLTSSERWIREFERFGYYGYRNSFDATWLKPDNNPDWQPLPKAGYEIVRLLKPAHYRNYNNHHIIFVSPGIIDVLCGNDWLDKHWSDLEDYHPIITMNLGGVIYNMNIKQPAILKDVMKANKLTRADRIRYAALPA
jgi:hypothetical protein